MPPRLRPDSPLILPFGLDEKHFSITLPELLHFLQHNTSIRPTEHYDVWSSSDRRRRPGLWRRSDSIGGLFALGHRVPDGTQGFPHVERLLVRKREQCVRDPALLFRFGVNT